MGWMDGWILDGTMSPSPPWSQFVIYIALRLVNSCQARNGTRLIIQQAVCLQCDTISSPVHPLASLATRTWHRWALWEASNMRAPR